ncbi:alpha/beta hydrolase [Bdellovibrio bacteriovorus]|uniref:alpha/beta hydrolase n=1 Tax=Bdellovibrio bacteriovorus TaxID=959 RepID=UPI003AA9DA62
MTKFSGLRRFFFGCIATMLLAGCQSFFYYPMKEKLFDPARIKLNPEDVYLTTSTGEKVHGWYFASAQADNKGTMLFFHGNAENLTSHFLMFQWLPSQGYNYFIFDYPGYGQSSGYPTPENTVAAGVAAAEWLHQKKDSRPLIVYGHSLGGIIALKTAEEVKGRIPLRNVVIEASFDSYQGMAKGVMNRHWFTWILQPLSSVVVSDEYAPQSLASLSPIPLLFITGTADKAVEPRFTENMYQNAAEPKELWLIPDGRHGNLYEIRNGELRDRFLSYLSKTLTVRQ